MLGWREYTKSQQTKAASYLTSNRLGFGGPLVLGENPKIPHENEQR